MNSDKELIKKEIEKALDEIRPFLQSDGGDVVLVDIKGDSAFVKFEGTCITCSVNQLTLKSGIESTITKNVPQIKRIVEIV